MMGRGVRVISRLRRGRMRMRIGVVGGEGDGGGGEGACGSGLLDDGEVGVGRGGCIYIL